MNDNATKLDIAPLTVIVSDALDPRVRRKMEAEQQAEVKTYEEMTKSMEMQDDLNKIKQEVEDDGEESDPFKQPEATEGNTDNTPDQPAPAQDPAPEQPAADNQAPAPAAEQQPAPAEGTQPAAPAAPAAQQPAEPAAGGEDEDLTSAFENHGTNLPKDLVRRVLKDYIKMESSETDTTGELTHIKNFVFISLGENKMGGDTLESVQTLRDPENTIVVFDENSSPNADTTLRARNVAKQLSNRGVKVFYDMDEAISYLNELYDVVTGRTKGSNE